MSIDYRTGDLYGPAAAPPVDYVISSIVTHHMSDDEIVRFLKWMDANARKGWFINDLHRHWLAYHSIKWLTRLFRGSYLVQHDAPLSVARAFRRADWVALLAQAGITQYELRWRWAVRWQVVFYWSAVNG